MRLTPVAYAERKSVLPKNTFLAIIYILILAILVVGVLSFISAWSITHPSKTSTPQISANIAPDYKNVSFTCSESKEKMNGWLFNCRGSKKTVLMVHGYGKNRLQFDEETFKLITRLNNEGYNVMAFDLRGAGNSAGSISTFGRNETSDVLSAIKYLKQQDSTEKIVLMGFSTGASACLSAAISTPYRDSIIGIIADSPYSRADNFLGSMISSKTILPDFPFEYTIKFVVKWISKADDSLDLINKVPNIIPTPVLFIDGMQEDISPYSNTKLLYELYFRKKPSTVYYWNSGAKDYLGSFLYAQNDYMDNVARFLNNIQSDKKK